jgi:xylulokinase
MDITGLPPSEMYALPKLMWMNKFTDVLSKARYIFFYEDYVGYLLTGKRVVSYSMASRSMAFDITKKAWSQSLLDAVNIDAAKLSTPMPSGSKLGTISAEMAGALNLPLNTIIAVGGHDQNCAALGGGVINAGMGEDGLGTCEVMVAMLSDKADKAIMLKNELPCVPYVLENSYLTFIEITTSGVLMNWCRDTIMSGIQKECREQDKNFFAFMDEQAFNADTADLHVLPQFGSSGNPNVNYEAKGLIWGLTIHTDLFQIYRAVKEGMAFQMRMAYESLEQIDTDLTMIALTGGGSASALTMQLRADIFGKEMLMLENREAGTLGCAILAGVALGKFDSIEQGVSKTVRVKQVFKPDPEKHKKYQIQYQQYKRLYEIMYSFK